MTALELISQCIPAGDINEISVGYSRDRQYEYHFEIWGYLCSSGFDFTPTVFYSEKCIGPDPITEDQKEACHIEVLKQIIRDGLYYRKDFLSPVEIVVKTQE